MLERAPPSDRDTSAQVETAAAAPAVEEDDILEFDPPPLILNNFCFFGFFQNLKNLLFLFTGLPRLRLRQMRGKM